MASTQGAGAGPWPRAGERAHATGSAVTAAAPPWRTRKAASSSARASLYFGCVARGGGGPGRPIEARFRHHEALAAAGLLRMGILFPNVL